MESQYKNLWVSNQRCTQRLIYEENGFLKEKKATKGIRRASLHTNTAYQTRTL